MAHGSKSFKFGAAFAAVGMVLSSTAHAAPRTSGGVDPLVAVSAFGTTSSRAAVCAGGTAAANTAGTALQSGASCLPFVAAASAAASAQDPQQEMGPAYAPVPEPRPLISALALPLGVFAVGVLLILLMDDGDDDDDDDDGGVSPQ